MEIYFKLLMHFCKNIKFLHITLLKTLYNIPPNTLFIGKIITYLPTCHSTNDIATELIHTKKATEGTVIITSNQTAGKGQKGNKWESEPNKNLTFSLILSPKPLKASQQIYLNMAMSVACYEFLNIFLADDKLKIKWSNDIFFEKKKIVGMLIENTIRGYYLQSSVVGIGININQVNFDETKATSLQKLNGTEYDLEQLLNILLEKIEKNYLKVKTSAFAELKQKYIQYQYQYNDIKNYQTADGKNFEGKIIDVDENGMLCIENLNGKTLKFNFKELVYL